MSTRRILHHGPTPTGTPVLLSDRAISGCWFELHRQGGCGAGELVLQREFHERRAIEIGDWISCEPTAGQRWYLGRVEECRFQYPGLMRLRLAGMSIELNEVFPGGFHATPPERQPRRYGATDLFSNDPDRNWEAAHSVSTVDGFVRLLLQHHVVNKTHISHVPSLIESPRVPIKALTAKFRGEESLRSVLKDLALRAQANWGVDAFGRFFFLRRKTTVQSTLRLGRDLTSLEETRDREQIFNRLLLTGDYIYDQRDNSGQIARRVFRWRASYFEPDSCRTFGNRRLRLWVPWIRTQSDSLDFAREFFRIYAQPTARFAVDTLPRSALLIPWEGPVTIEDASGTHLSTGIVEKVRVLFDHAPRFRLEVGPEDPREQWPEPPQDERWELPDHVPSHGGDVVVTDRVHSSDGGGGGGDSSPGASSSVVLTDDSSDISSDLSSSQASSDSSVGSSDESLGDTTQSGTSLNTTFPTGLTSTFTSVENSSHTSESSRETLHATTSQSWPSSTDMTSLLSQSSSVFPPSSEATSTGIPPSEMSSSGVPTTSTESMSESSCEQSEPTQTSSEEGSTSSNESSLSNNATTESSDSLSGSEAFTSNESDSQTNSTESFTSGSTSDGTSTNRSWPPNTGTSLYSTPSSNFSFPWTDSSFWLSSTDPESFSQS